MSYRERVDAMLETLLAHPDILVHELYVPKPCKPSAIEDVEKKLGHALDESIRAFYAEMNGLELRWFHKDRDPEYIASVQRTQAFSQLMAEGREKDAFALNGAPAEVSYDVAKFGEIRERHYAEKSTLAPWRKRQGSKINQLSFTRAERMASGTINIRPLKDACLATDKYWKATVKKVLKEGVGAMVLDVGGASYDMKTLYTKVLKPLDITHAATQVVLWRPDGASNYRVKRLDDYFADGTRGSSEVSFDAYLDAVIASFGFRSFERSLFHGEPASPLSLDALPAS